MKIPFLLFLLLDVLHLKGQERINKVDHILLRFDFPSIYNSYGKLCCKLYPGGCYYLLDTTGYTSASLNGRVSITENDGWIEVKISNVQPMDRGYYRCIVLGTENHVYSDYLVEVSEISEHHSQLQPALTTTATTQTYINYTKLPDSTQDGSNTPSLWSFEQLLAVIVSIVMISIAVVIAAVCCKVKAKLKQPRKCGKTVCESLKTDTSEMGGVVYTAVAFRPHQMPTEVYANLTMHRTEGKAPDSSWSAEHNGMVEYSTLAAHQ